MIPPAQPGSEPPGPRSDLGILLLVAYQAFVRGLHEEMASHGYDDLGSSDGVVFRLLHAEPRTVSDLAGRLGISKQGAAQIVEDMERRGYLVRRPDPNDGRARLVGLSERGAGALGVAREFHSGYEQRLVAGQGQDAVDTVRSVLRSMTEDAPEGLYRELRSLYL
ncbi:MarR family winged helix-turn-helix transcriptional regulator [Nocardioides marmorisolisilvae]|uniref:MarR family transcriptional regulator n=1 Tax=Nocardioides marmorisolisilvae TaxID=1542737 RepID=A0A3N0DZP0_9ACTN|nr:MarR family winged helix-turn-helix transcriptional regulator [Nocardioides marmorisolisilvae]RNL81062.1 MarR family transcriptional regulator [Nocardioides marmorisolisilvae]